MISFNNGDGNGSESFDPEDIEDLLNKPSSPEVKGLKKLLDAIFNNSFNVGSTYKDLHPLEIAKIIDYIIYNENYDNLNLTITREPNDKLALRINVKA